MERFWLVRGQQVMGRKGLCWGMVKSNDYELEVRE